MRRIIIFLTALVSISFLLCSCGKVNGYKKKDLVPVSETAGTSGVQVFVVDHNEGKDLTVKIKNYSKEDFAYGEYYSIQLYADGTWYYVPEKEDHAVYAVLHNLPGETSDSMTYSLAPYGGKLNSGKYRIACCGSGKKENVYYAYFDVADNGRFTWEVVEPTGR